jgi:processive 1,2-diacylglycerol beta-glucosyltransferase
MSSTPDKSGGPRVLILSASVGAGHNQAARAVAEALGQAMPAATVEVRDTLDFAPRLFRAYYAGGYALMVTKMPWLYGFGFRLNDRPHTSRRGLRERWRLWNEWPWLGRLRSFVTDFRPDLVVNTHFLAGPVLGRMIRQGHLRVPQMVVVTDILMHRYWFSEQVEHWFAPAEPTGERLRQWGVAPANITVSGIPVQLKWTLPVDRPAVLAEWRLPTDRPIVLLSGGAEFVCGNIVDIARQIASRCERAFVAVLAGRNKGLLADLARLPEAGRSIVGIAFTDRVHELVHVCSLMATKAGGLSTAECLAKGTPMVLLKPVPGQERGNAEFFARRGAGVIAHNDAEVVEHVSRLLSDPGELERMSQAARGLYRPGAQTIAQAIRRAVGG